MRILSSSLKPRKIQPPFNPKIETIRGFNGLAPLSPPKPPFTNVLNIHRGPRWIKGGCPLRGPAFDDVEFDCKMEESWTDNDDLLLEKLQDKFMKVQDIEIVYFSSNRVYRDTGKVFLN